MVIRVSVEALVEALGVASIVSPKPVGQQNVSGFLFTVKGGGLSIYSRSNSQQTKAVLAVEGDDGSFIFPVDRVSALKHLSGWIEIEAGIDEEGTSQVKYSSEGGAKQSFTTVDASFIAPIDTALAKAIEGGSYPAALLKEAFGVTKGYLAPPNDRAVGDVFKVAQLFPEDTNGSGHLFSANSYRACYFYSDGLKGKGLGVHCQHLSALNSFLAHCGEEEVTVRYGDSVTYLVSKVGVFGWATHQAKHERFNYYPLKSDGFILRMDKSIFVKALKYVRAGLDSRQNRVCFTYSHTDQYLKMAAGDASGEITSMPVPVVIVNDEGAGGGLGDKEDFTSNVNIDYLLDLVSPTRGHELDLRVARLQSSAQFLFRTIETYWIDSAGKVLVSSQDTNKGAFECRVTRFMPSRD